MHVVSVTFSMTSPMKFYYTRTLMTLFGDFKDVHTIDAFWKFMETDLLENLYWEYDYGIDSNAVRKYKCPDSQSSVGPCSVTPMDRNILYENKLLGLPRYIFLEFFLSFWILLLL